MAKSKMTKDEKRLFNVMVYGSMIGGAVAGLCIAIGNSIDARIASKKIIKTFSEITNKVSVDLEED